MRAPLARFGGSQLAEQLVLVDAHRHLVGDGREHRQRARRQRVAGEHGHYPDEAAAGDERVPGERPPSLLAWPTPDR
jgi:hypothetical protein